MARLNSSLRALQRAQQTNEQQETSLKKRMYRLGSALLTVGIIGCSVAGYHWYRTHRSSLESSTLDVSSTNVQRSFPADVTFEDARRDAGKRQRFLDALLQGYEIPGCSGVIYDSDGEKIITFLNAAAVNG